MQEDKSICPECSEVVADEAVICLNCGFNLKTGAKAATQTDDDDGEEEQASVIPTNAPGINIVGLLFGIFLVFIGIVGLVVFLSLQAKANASKNWPEADGKIIVSQAMQVRGRKGKLIKRAAIQYSYQVGNKHYSSNSIYYRAAAEGSDVDRVVGKFPKGASVKVRYKPDSPKECCLIPGSAASHKIGLVVMGALMVLGIGVGLKSTVL